MVVDYIIRLEGVNEGFDKQERGVTMNIGRLK